MAEDILKKICLRTLADLKTRQEDTPLEALKEQLQDAPAPRGFYSAIQTKINNDQTALICEIKKASPSKGLIREDFNPAELAKAYELGGATCLSILTDVPFFQGDMTYLKQARAACNLPVLRKDFILDPYQVYEARTIGADCILLIAAALDDGMMERLYALAKDIGMDVLVEVHDETELLRAKKLKPELMGINNRNLKTLEIDINTSHVLAELLEDMDCTPVSESGIYSREEIENLQKSGFNTFLIGESLMRQHDVEAATKSLLAA